MLRFIYTLIAFNLNRHRPLPRQNLTITSRYLPAINTSRKEHREQRKDSFANTGFHFPKICTIVFIIESSYIIDIPSPLSSRQLTHGYAKRKRKRKRKRTRTRKFHPWGIKSDHSTRSIVTRRRTTKNAFQYTHLPPPTPPAPLSFMVFLQQQQSHSPQYSFDIMNRNLYTLYVLARRVSGNGA